MKIDELISLGAHVVAGSIECRGAILGRIQSDGTVSLNEDGQEWLAQVAPASAPAKPAETAKPARASKLPKMVVSDSAVTVAQIEAAPVMTDIPSED